jgi:hypothetical protein
MNNSLFKVNFSSACRSIFILCLFLTNIAGNKIEAQNHNWVIDTANHYVLANTSPFNIMPGDTVFINAGNRNHLQIRNIAGTSEKPVIIINKGGVVTINTMEYYGISMHNCKYFRLTGTGDKDNFYGIQIKSVASGAGVGIGTLSSDYEIDHISIENCKSGGIYAKSDPDCSFSSTREKFTQHNTIIHDCYVANVAYEGMYIGNTTYAGQTVNCDGKDTVLIPSLLKGVRVYNNIIKYSGWDGLQISSASEDCQVFNNQILYDSQAEYNYQASGILLGGGSSCDCYNNYIAHGKGNGIESHGIGGNRIFNNIILEPGLSYLPLDQTKLKHGIFVSDASTMADSSFYILFNTIISPKSDGIRFQSVKSKKSIIASNLIVNPGTYDYYQNGNAWMKGKDSYIMLPSSASDVTVMNNYMTRSLASAMVMDSTFAILPGSPLINAAYSNRMGINFDFRNYPRPSGYKSDIGAMEFDQASIDSLFQVNILTNAFPNPVKSIFTVRYYSDLHLPSELIIYNQLGSLILKVEHHPVLSDEEEIVIDVAEFPAGIYLFSLRLQQKVIHGTFVKVNG